MFARHRQVRLTRFARGFAAAVLAGVLSLPTSGHAADLDLALLLAVDVSRSVDPDEYDLQMGGFADAFADPLVHDAIRVGAPNGMAVALMLWSGPDEQILALPWAIVRNEADAKAFGGRIDALARPLTNGGTALAEALARATTLVNGSPAAQRRVIDVSGDGTDNREESPAAARDAAVALGIVVNALAVSNDQPYLPGYYRTQVAGGPGSFVMRVRTFRDFGEAIRAKLIREIAGQVVGLLSPAARPSAVPGLARPPLPR